MIKKRRRRNNIFWGHNAGPTNFSFGDHSCHNSWRGACIKISAHTPFIHADGMAIENESFLLLSFGPRDNRANDLMLLELAHLFSRTLRHGNLIDELDRFDFISTDLDGFVCPVLPFQDFDEGFTVVLDLIY